MQILAGSVTFLRDSHSHGQYLWQVSTKFQQTIDGWTTGRQPYAQPKTIKPPPSAAGRGIKSNVAKPMQSKFRLSLWLGLELATQSACTVASPGFVARRGKARNYVMGHSPRTSGPVAAAA